MSLNCLFLKFSTIIAKEQQIKTTHMETIISTIVIIACTYFFTRRKVKPIEQETDDSTQPEDSTSIQQEEKQEEPPHTKDLCIKLLKQLNCEVFVSEEEENRLDFKYQGEIFVIFATNESFFIDIWDPKWYIVPLDDLEQMSNVRKAINTINSYSGTTIIYCIEEEEQKFVLHSKCHCILPKELSCVKEYLRVLLDDFFAVQKWLSKEIVTQNKEN